MPAQRKSSTGTADASPARKSATKATAKAAPKDGSKAAPEADPKPVEPEAVEPTGAEPVEPTAEEDVPMNRAERRARGKGGQQSLPPSRGKVAGQHGPAHTHRNWASRRSG
jgi:hypothetical protein